MDVRTFSICGLRSFTPMLSVTCIASHSHCLCSAHLCTCGIFWFVHLRTCSFTGTVHLRTCAFSVLRTSTPTPSLILCTSRYREFISPQIYPRFQNSQIRSCIKEISTHQQIWLISSSFFLDLGLTITPQLIIRNSDLVILKIFNTLVSSQMISFPFYSQGLTQTMDQNHWETILGTQNLGSIF